MRSDRLGGSKDGLKRGLEKSKVRLGSKVTGWGGEAVVRSGRLGWSEVEIWRCCEVALGGAGVRLRVWFRNFLNRPPSTRVAKEAHAW